MFSVNKWKNSLLTYAHCGNMIKLMALCKGNSWVHTLKKCFGNAPCWISILLSFVSNKYLQRKHTHFILTIPLETRVAVALARIGSGIFLQMVGEVYGITKTTISIIVQKFCEVVFRHLKPIVFMKPTNIRIKKWFQNLKFYITFHTSLEPLASSNYCSFYRSYILSL